MPSMRDYINLIESLNEASWWTRQNKAPATTSSAQPQALTGVARPKTNMPAKPKLPPEFSAAIQDMFQFSGQFRYGGDQSAEASEHITYLATNLKKMAAEFGRQQYIPLLDEIIANLHVDRNHQADLGKATAVINQLKTQFNADMAKA